MSNILIDKLSGLLSSPIAKRSSLPLSLLYSKLWTRSAASIDGIVLDESSGLGTARPMQPGRCKAFDGGNDFLYTADNPITTQDFSFSFWLNPDNLAGNVIYGSGNPAATNGIGYIAYVHSDGYVLTGINDGVGTLATANSPVGVVAGQWHHVCVTYDRDGNGICYLDGVAGTPVNISGKSGTLAGSEMRIGRYGEAGIYFDGRLFDFQIFDRVLTPAEIVELRDLGAAALPGVQRLRHYKLDEQHPTITYDSSGNGGDLLASGVVATVGNFFYEGADVPFSWQNDVGYSNLFIDDKNVYVPRRETEVVPSTWAVSNGVWNDSQAWDDSQTWSDT